MKKNKMMRIASVLLIVTLLSTCAISGTFAKYVTQANGEGSARVAKWGVVINMTGAPFAKTYNTKDGNYVTHTGTNTLAVESTEFVVAPGTSSDETGNSFKATVAGTPEVAAAYELQLIDSAIKEITLAPGEYVDYTQLIDGEYPTFELASEYKPVKLGLTVWDGATKVASKTGLTLDQLKQALRDYGNTGTDKLLANMAPNTQVAYTFELNWEWKFEANGATGTYVDANGNEVTGDVTNQADTYLGNIIAGVIPADDRAKTTEAYGFIATATQID